MITPDYVVTLSRYNGWQNRQVIDVVGAMEETDLRQDRGAFFGSILNTLNHILWGDTMWLSRFSAAFDPPNGPAAEHINYTESPRAWCSARRAFDDQLQSWADALSASDLVGDLTWSSGMTGQTLTLPRALCVGHLFNHQTHHRGQVHAMLTAAGQKAPVTDICFMPEDG
ncbi:MAG: DinB family protein [Pseudomonadota bacterium]